MKKVYPVIHHVDNSLTLDQAGLAFECGADGVFVISHNGQDADVVNNARLIHMAYPDKDLGVNLLSTPIQNVAKEVLSSSCINMVWYDSVGIHSDANSSNPQMTRLISDQYKDHDVKVFAGVAFKYQKEDNHPHIAAYDCARHYGFIPTTSGRGTGYAPALDKIKTMYEYTDGLLAIASGMDYNNILQFAPHLSHILVATGVSKSEYEFDYHLLRSFIGKVRSLDHE